MAALDDGRMQLTNSSMTIEYRHSSGKIYMVHEKQATVLARITRIERRRHAMPLPPPAITARPQRERRANSKLADSISLEALEDEAALLDAALGPQPQLQPPPILAAGGSTGGLAGYVSVFGAPLHVPRRARSTRADGSEDPGWDGDSLPLPSDVTLPAPEDEQAAALLLGIGGSALLPAQRMQRTGFSDSDDSSCAESPGRPRRRRKPLLHLPKPVPKRRKRGTADVEDPDFQPDAGSGELSCWAIPFQN